MSAVQVQVPEKHLVRVLVIDDALDFQTEMRDFWEQQGYAITIASNLSEGEHLLETNIYDIVIADVRFKYSKLTGDEVILRHQTRLRETKVFVVTAQGLNNVRYYNDLSDLGYKVVDKSELSFPDMLQDAANETVRERRSFFERGVKKALRSELGDASVSVSFVPAPIPDGAGALEKELKNNNALETLSGDIQEALTLWLRSRSQPNDPVIAIGPKVMSANDLADAIETGNEYGVTLLRMFLNEFKHLLGINVVKG